MGNVIDNIKKYYLLGSALALAVMYFLLDRRGRTIRQLNEEAQVAKLAASLQDIKKESEISDANYEKSLKRYNDLKRIHPNLFDKASSGDNKP